MKQYRKKENQKEKQYKKRTKNLIGGALEELDNENIRNFDDFNF